MHHRTKCAVRLILAFAILAGPALAQDEADEDELAGVDEIVVKITKRTTSLQNVAGTISAFNEDMIRETNIEKIADAVALIPNVQIKGGTNDSISIRGISQSFVSQSPVARHVNGIFKWGNESYTGQFYDLEGIEVARGPSGTIYGRNATAGAIDVRWKKPHAEWETFGDVTIANTDRYHFRGGVNIPLLGPGDDRLAARIVFQREVHDGWVDNELTTRRRDPDRGDDLFLRGSLRSVISEDIEIILRGFWHDREDGTISSTPVLDRYLEGQLTIAPLSPIPFTTDPYNGFTQFKSEIAPPGSLYFGVSTITQAQCFPVLTAACVDPTIQTFDDALEHLLVEGFSFGGIPIPGFFRSKDSFQVGQPILQGERKTRSNAHLNGFGDLRIFGADGQLDWSLHDVPLLGDVGLVLSGGWERYERTQITDLDGTELFILDVNTSWIEDHYTAEINFQSEGDGPLQWIAGFFWFSREREAFLDTVVSFLTPESDSITKESGFAPFLSLEYTPVEWVDLFGGVRWNRDRYFIDRFDAGVPIQPVDLALRATDKFRETTYELGARFHLTDDHMVYAKFSHGYKAGLLELNVTEAVNQIQAGFPLSEVQFENAAQPELVDAYEIGARTQWLEGLLTVNLTGFYYDYTNLQVTNISGAQVLTENAADATVWGVELEMILVPTPEWLIMLSVGHLDATFDEFCSDDPFVFMATSEPGCPAPVAGGLIGGINGRSNLEGNRLEDSPKWDVAVVTRYEIDLGEWGTLTPVAEFQFTDSYFARPYNLDIDEFGSRTKTDLRLIWKEPDGRYSIELFVENLEDEVVYGRRLIGGEFAGGFPIQAGTFPPRIYGVRIGFQLGGS